jgi:hypothetical protein
MGVMDSIGLLIATLTLGHFLSKTPIEHLGQRPMGRGLWGWLWNFRGTSIWGYDSSLGAWSPVMRLALHLSVSRLLYSVSGVTGVAAYLTITEYLHFIRPNVSHPGGPRAHKIQRQPKFQNVDKTVDATGWTCLVAHKSHEDTANKFGGSQLTGEPVGRQMWSKLPNTKNQKGAKEALVQRLAAGGRTQKVFNAAMNPNRYGSKYALSDFVSAFKIVITRVSSVATWFFAHNRFETTWRVANSLPT